jgi:hypothetical protein
VPSSRVRASWLRYVAAPQSRSLRVGYLRLTDQRLYYIFCQESGRLRYWVQGEEMKSPPGVSRPLYILLPTYLPCRACLRSAVAQASLGLAFEQARGWGNCNATVTPETMQAICKGSRDDLVDCYRLHVLVGYSYGLGVRLLLSWRLLLSLLSSRRCRRRLRCC